MVPLGPCKEGVIIHTIKRTVIYFLYPYHNDTSSEKCMKKCLKDDLCVPITSMNDESKLCKLKTTKFISGYTYYFFTTMSLFKKCLVPKGIPSHIIPHKINNSKSALIHRLAQDYNICPFTYARNCKYIDKLIHFTTNLVKKYKNLDTK